MQCVPVSTGTSKVDKLLKMPSDSISEGVIFQHFLGGILLLLLIAFQYNTVVKN